MAVTRTTKPALGVPDGTATPPARRMTFSCTTVNAATGVPACTQGRATRRGECVPTYWYATS